MGRKSAAQIAQEEMAAAKAAKLAEQKTSESNSGGEIVTGDAITPENENGVDSGDSGDSGGGNSATALENSDFPIEFEKVHAVALRNLPGTEIKLGQIIKAPKHMVDEWVKAAWVDTHENALKIAEQKYEHAAQNLALNSPGSRMSHPPVSELDHKGQIVESVLEE